LASLLSRPILTSNYKCPNLNSDLPLPSSPSHFIATLLPTCWGQNTCTAPSLFLSTRKSCWLYLQSMCQFYLYLTSNASTLFSAIFIIPSIASTQCSKSVPV
jgi:hypothetical protein